MTSATKAEIEEWVERIEEVTGAIQDILQEDPMEALQRKAARESRQLEEKERLEKERLNKIKIRYEPKYYNRFDRDDVIDAMLKEAEMPTRKGAAARPRVGGEDPSASLSRSEAVSLAEARRLKEEAAAAVQNRDWGRAEALYTAAIQLQPVEDELVRVLHNNRALARINLRSFLDALSDASFVLQRSPKDIKALLRRAVALRHLHRPVEALEDVNEVLKMEPKNVEAQVQHAWLRKGELELLASNRFLATEAPGRADSQGSPAERLCKVISLLSSPEAAGEGAFSSAFAVSLVEALRGGVDVLHAHGMGACVFFAHRGGLLPGLSIARRLLDLGCLDDGASTAKDSVEMKADPEEPRRSARLHATLLIPLLQLLAEVWGSSEISTQMVEVELVRDFLGSLVGYLVGGLRGPTPCEAKKEVIRAADPVWLTPERSNLFDAALQCLKSLTLRYFALVRSAVEGVNEIVGEGLLSALWNSPYLQTSISSGRVWVTLYYFMGCLDAFLKQGGPPPSQMSFSPSERDLWSQLYSIPPHTGSEGCERKACLVLDVVVRVFSSTRAKPWCPLPDAMRPLMECTAAELTLHLTSAVSRRANQNLRCGGFQWMLETLSSKRFTMLLRDTFQSAFSRMKASSSLLPSLEDSRLLEALYAIVYNLVLFQEDRGAYARQWFDLADPQGESTSLTDQVLIHLSMPNVGTSSCLTPLGAKMLGVFAKFLTVGEASFQANLCRREGFVNSLWRWVGVAVGALEGAGADGQGTKSIAWEYLEHLTTILAFLQKQNRVVVVENVGLLVSLISLAPLRLMEASLQAIVVGAQEGTEMPPTQLHGQTLAFSVASVVAAGNAALLISMIPSFPPPPPTLSSCERATELLLKVKAIDVLLQGLRDAHNSAGLVAHEVAEMNKQKTNSTSVISYLQRWSGYLRSTTKNLAISISRVCAIGGEPIKDRLRELKGFETLLAVQQ